MRRGPSRAVWWALGGGSLLAVAVLIMAVAAMTRESSEPSLPATAPPPPTVSVTAPSAAELEVRAGQLAAEYLDAWERSDWTSMRLLAGDPPADFASRHVVWTGDLGVVAAELVPGQPVVAGATATVPFAATLQLAGLGEWAYDGRLQLARSGNDWLVEWSPATLHPSFAPGLEWEITRTRPTRAPLLDRNGDALAAEAAIVTVGIEPRRVEDRALVAAALEPLGVAAEQVDELLDDPNVQPDAFLPVLDLLATRYAELEESLHPVPGLVFRRSTERLAATDELGVHTVGRVGEITSELLQRFAPDYRVGDQVGRSGLELAFERQLAGRPTATLRLVDADGKQVVSEEFPGMDAAPVTTTIDLAVQRAAEEAMAGVEEAAGLVAVDAATGGVLAMVSLPRDGFSRAIGGAYAPGSTFKIVTALAALRAGLALDDAVECPETIGVDGREFRNAEGTGTGTITFRQAFARSCNTAFIGLALQRTPEELATAAAALGFNAGYELPLPTASGSYPVPAGRVEQAAAAIGQGRVTASPLHMATVAAAVADGAWRAPILLLGAEGAPRPLDPAHAAALRELMRAVVASGTGTRADVAGAPVHGKTGSAQFDPGDPEATHAWFVGFREQLAFAIVIEAGGSGGGAAAPVAAAFLEALGS